jgi:hypothetical protein
MIVTSVIILTDEATELIVSMTNITKSVHNFKFNNFISNKLHLSTDGNYYYYMLQLLYMAMFSVHHFVLKGISSITM